MINITQHRGVLYFPSDEDLNGAAVALMRLQDTYKLDTHALANGDLLGKKYSRQLTGKGLFKAISSILFSLWHYYLYSWRLLGTWSAVVQQRRSLPHGSVDGRSFEQVGRRIKQNCHSK
jgi:hypothetical protein